MTRTAALPALLSLAAGECRMMRVASGSRWTVRAGRVRLTEPPRALGGRSIAIEQLLCEGSSHGVDDSGWVRLQALTAAVLAVDLAAVPNAGWPHRLLAARLSWIRT